MEKVVAGPERKSRRLTEAVKKREAYHEVGRALLDTAYRASKDMLAKHRDELDRVAAELLNEKRWIRLCSRR